MSGSRTLSRRAVLRQGAGAAAALGLATFGFTARHAAASDALAPGTDFTVQTDALNLRAGHGLDEDVLTVLVYGAAGTITGGPIPADGYTWYEVDVGQPGWLAGEYIGVLDSGEPKGLRLQVVDGPLNLRSGPSLSAEIWWSIPTGATLRVLQADGGTWADGYHWLYVMVEAQNPLRGFIADAFTAPI